MRLQRWTLRQPSRAELYIVTRVRQRLRALHQLVHPRDAQARQATLDLSRALMHSTQTRAVSEPLGVLRGLFGITSSELVGEDR